MEIPRKNPISYSCIKCGYTTNRKSNYMYHINRKIPCVAVVNNLSDSDNTISLVNHEFQNVNNNSSNVNRENFSNMNNSSNVNHENFSNMNNSSNVNPENFSNMNNSSNVNHENFSNMNNSSQINDTNFSNSKPMFICDLCQKQLSNKYKLRDHKEKCKGVHSLQCPICRKEFKYAQSKYKHMKYVKCEPVSPSPPLINTTNNNTTNNNTTNNTTNNNNNITNNNNTTINNNNQKQIIHQHIQVNAFGNENYDYLLDENQLLKRILQQKDAFMQKIIEAVHFDKEHPENHNIQMTNLQSKHIMIHDGTKFVKALKEPTFDKLIQKKRNMINGNIEECGLTIGSERYIKEKLATLRVDDEKRKTLKDKIELMCYNKREEVCENNALT